MIRRLLLLALIAGFATPALALKQFQDQFMATYAADSEADFTTTAKQAKCFICHQGKKKSNRNPYGEALSELLDKRKDKKDVEKILAALETVAAQKVDPENEESPTFGDLIEEGKLPGGALEEAKQEPTDG